MFEETPATSNIELRTPNSELPHARMRRTKATQ
jgi:hypothetical protein